MDEVHMVKTSLHRVCPDIFPKPKGSVKMVGDSTKDNQSPVKGSKRKKTISKKKGKKLKKSSGKKTEKKKNEEDSENDSDLDLDKDLQPIGSYIRDRQEMMEQMFHCLRGASLQRNLPDILKDLPMEELKQRCLEQLEIMSKKRIRRILDGDDPATISSSGTEDESTDEDGTGNNIADEETVTDSPYGVAENPINIDSVEEAVTEDNADETGVNLCEGGSYEEGSDQEAEEQNEDDDDEEEEEGEIREGQGHKDSQSSVNQSEEENEDDNDPPTEDHHSNDNDKDVSETCEKGDDSCEEIEEKDVEEEEEEESANIEEVISGGDNSESEGEIDEGASENEETTEQEDRSLGTVLTQNQMEILELEMRARAIKAMLKAQEVKDKQLSAARK